MKSSQAVATFVCKFYLWLVIWTGYLSYYYLSSDIPSLRERKNLRRGLNIANALLSSAVVFLPLHYHNGKDDIYSHGPAVTYTFIVSAVYILGCLVMTKVFEKQLNPNRKRAIRIWMILESIGAVMQYCERRLLFISYTMMIGIVILYAKLENPDSKLDRETNAYSFRTLRDHVKELYENHQHCAFIIIVEDEVREKDALTGEILMLELTNFLSGVSEKRVFRGYGNDFLMTFPDEKTAREVLPKIQQRFVKPFAKNYLMDPKIYLIPDISVTSNAAELLAMYNYYSYYGINSESKVIVIDAAALSYMKEYREVQSEIISALAEDRIEVFYQPIYSVEEKKFVSAEALVRMRDSSGELVFPGTFIPVAEKSGLIEQIGDRVFEKVCSFIHNYDIQKMGLHYIEVNLSVVQCENNSLAERYTQIISSYDILPSAINLEITETGQLKQKHILMNNMTELRKIGCSFSLDDFGTGESNLNYIVDMPVDIVKFDRSMILSYFNNDRTKLMMEYVVSMIKTMGMKIVAEGVEKEYQLEALSRLGIDYIQGYYFSRPLPQDSFISFIIEKNQQ
jgi:EAL domain-containing protein (putative c-di-GMP-specific phosphodiesterase class I)